MAGWGEKMYSWLRCRIVMEKLRKRAQRALAKASMVRLCASTWMSFGTFDRTIQTKGNNPVMSSDLGVSKRTYATNKSIYSPKQPGYI